MEKATETRYEGDERANVTHMPIVAEGAGKTALAEGARQREVHNAEFYAAVAESKIPLWNARSRKLYFAAFVAFCCSCANGYDGSLMGSITFMTQFQNVMGSTATGWKVSVMTSLYSVGSIAATPFAAHIADRYGRKMGMICGAIGIILGAVIATSAFSIAQVTVGRIVLGAGIQFMTVSAGAYAMEVAPPQWRGRFTGFYNTGWYGGSIPAAIITYGTQFIGSSWSWRVPFLCQCFACIIVLCSVWFIPESPRWLFAHERGDEAIEFLIDYHGNGNRDSRLVKLEIEEIQESIRQEYNDRKLAWWDFSCLFNCHEARWRSYQVILMGVSGQFSGNGLGYFNPQIFSELGVTSKSQSLGYNVLGSVLSAIAAGTGVSLTDKMPRRKVLITGTIVAALLLAVNGALSDTFGKSHSPTVGRASLAFYFLFNCAFPFTYTPLQSVIPAEALNTSRRAKGLAFYGLLCACLGFINTFCTPIANGTIQFNYIWVFVGWDLVEALLWYLLGVEMQGRTLEELDWVFKQPNPLKASLQLDKIVQQADGRVTEKIVHHDD